MTRRFLFSSVTALLMSLSGVPLMASSPEADADWRVIEQLDKGPATKPKTAQEAAEAARAHLARQLAAVKAFQQKYPNDPRVFDARLRQAAIMAAQGKMANDQKQVDEALRIYSELERDRSQPEEKRADVAFRRVALYIQSVHGEGARRRDSIVDAVEKYAARYPQDRRAARLLVEAATICDEVPARKRRLLESARQLSQDRDLNIRIADDLKRLDLLGKQLNLKFSTIQGREVDLSKLRGRVVALLFWQADSPQCLLWLRDFQQAVSRYSSGQVVVVTVSLDESRKKLEEVMKQGQINWLTNFDGKGWENAVARPLGINALPTLWMIDKKGVLRALNARDSYETWLRKLTTE